MTDMQKAARAYITPNGKRQAWAIFPTGKWKTPIIKGGKGCLDATTDREQIDKWWNQYPNANIGIATGEVNGFLVIDIDRNHTDGVDGEESLRELAQRLGDLPDTVEALTPNGGRHLYFKYPAGRDIRNKANLVPGIDVRANGGYVLGAPSRIESGKQYTWEVNGYPHEVEMAALPDAWEKLLAEQCREVEIIPQGRRNDTIFHRASSLRAQNYSEDAMRKEVEKLNRECCQPPLPDREVDAILKSVLKFPAGTPMKQMDLPQTDQQPRKPRLSQEVLAEELYLRGYDARYNDITGEYEMVGRTDAGRCATQDDLITIMHNALAGSYKGVSFDLLSNYIAFHAREHHYNPVMEQLASIQWDGKDRLPQLYALMGIEQDELSKTLVRKWLYQAVALLFNDMDDPFGADGCLVLNGDQGAGKTSLFRHLALRDAWFGEGCSIDDRDKDTGRRVITKWISELGEVESTLKSDVSKLKAFVTASVDRYRLPYGKADVVAPRYTSLCATCNSDRYLIDPTGNRRWWSVPFKRRVPREELLALDALQLWGQIYASVAPLSYSEKKSCFRLTIQELDELAARNGEYEKPLKGQLEVEDILTKAKRENLPLKTITVSEWKAEWEVLRPYSVQNISAALKRCKIEPKHTKAGSVADLPVRGLIEGFNL